MALIECGINSCVYCEPFDKSYGYCKHEERTSKGIVLKFRMAFDAGKGTIVMVECLNMELPGGPEEREAA